ncbi:DUF3293 domain-containing protein [Jeongeupia naejangsanensis]|uniref:DUF3293 domain-containing protein n=1 Tax=Jeongeupia naejangsanensis TaxID=613195 RepID=A0ABS2BLP7_9NEIS|nr:DUF3293 domain-containing protein [Jeongeupia naejangsanensis]MBM3115699.1 DUF3293 domain-containing protein [Jeongeupia naejangsanensis]
MDAAERQRLDAAYRATRYVVPALRLGLRIGRHHSDLDAVLLQYGVVAWAFVSAANPRSVALCEHENRARHQNLLDALRWCSLVCFEGAGEPLLPGWAPEPSVLVLGLSQADAVRLGCEFDQHAVVCGVLSSPAVLCWCDAGV